MEMTTGTLRRTILAGAALALLAACEEGQGFGNPFQQNAQSSQEDNTAPTGTGRMVERDVEAPEVFSATEAGLWDGRPSLGVVWVAHPDVKDPERVIIRNEANNQFVIGALFRKERETPGPRIQVSSDAADALGMLAGQPQELALVAVRQEEVEIAPILAPAGHFDKANLKVGILRLPKRQGRGHLGRAHRLVECV